MEEYKCVLIDRKVKRVLEASITQGNLNINDWHSEKDVVGCIGRGKNQFNVFVYYSPDPDFISDIELFIKMYIIGTYLLSTPTIFYENMLSVIKLVVLWSVWSQNHS